MGIGTEDIDACFSTGDFAVTGTFTLTGGKKVAVNGFLDDPTGDAGVGDVNVEALQPTFTAPTAALPGTDRGAVLKVGDATYKVVVTRKVGNGISVCYLK